MPFSCLASHVKPNFKQFALVRNGKLLTVVFICVNPILKPVALKHQEFLSFHDAAQVGDRYCCYAILLYIVYPLNFFYSAYPSSV
ncbi:hypothetical protein DSO57_1025218 [Entomophthora muscae]|uniref:Uncharacterized protein n=1 Tax=Entomophthora muscae TaxID=34485 RepID=A0ACC2S4B9_9FUNG|nr:hypothetical protein DSO57_1025218 [Entomophthora muscae]